MEWPQWLWLLFSEFGYHKGKHKKQDQCSLHSLEIYSLVYSNRVKSYICCTLGRNYFFSLNVSAISFQSSIKLFFFFFALLRSLSLIFSFNLCGMTKGLYFLVWRGKIFIMLFLWNYHNKIHWFQSRGHCLHWVLGCGEVSLLNPQVLQDADQGHANTKGTAHGLMGPFLIYFLLRKENIYTTYEQQ